jgi:Ca2+-binding RTX toxin-like protein
LVLWSYDEDGDDNLQGYGGADLLEGGADFLFGNDGDDIQSECSPQSRKECKERREMFSERSDRLGTKAPSRIHRTPVNVTTTNLMRRGVQRFASTLRLRCRSRRNGEDETRMDPSRSR